MAELTVEQAKQVLAGDPSQEELFAALLTLNELDPLSYQTALSQAAELLSAQSEQPITADQVDAVVTGLQNEPGSELGIPEPPPFVEDDDELTPIAMPRGYQVPSKPVTQRKYGNRSVPGPDPYLPGDQWGLSGLSQTEIRRRQKRLEKAGLLKPGYTPGFWDQATADALFLAMGYANIQVTDVDSIISELEQLRPTDRPDASDIKKFVPPPEIKPDPAAIAQRVKREFRSQLGRDPTDEEMAGFAGYLTGQYASAYDAQVAMDRALFDAENMTPTVPTDRAFQSDIGGMPVGPTPPTIPTSFVDVNPDARFTERFEDRFGPEIDRLAALPETRQNMTNVFSSLSTMSSLVG